MAIPYESLLDSEALVRLEAKLGNFDRASELRSLRANASVPWEPGSASGSDELFFRREIDSFAEETRGDGTLRNYILGEAKLLNRAIAICGRLSALPSFSYDYITLAALLAHVGPAIWEDGDWRSE